MEIQKIILLSLLILYGNLTYANKFDGGFVAPSVNGISNAYSPERGALVFDTLTNVFWGNNGIPSTPNWVSLTQTTQNYASGYFDAGYGWSMGTDDENYHEFSNTAVGTFNVVNSSGITVTAAASNLMGITFTPASTIATYRITFNGILCTDTAPGSTEIGLELYDSGNSIQVDEINLYSIVTAGQTTLSGIYTPGTTSAVTVSVQSSIGAYILECGGYYMSNSLVNWDIQQIK